MNEFSVAGCIRFGWETFKKRPWFLIGVTALFLVASWVAGAVGGAFGNNGLPAAAGGIVNAGLSMLLSMGITAFFLHANDAIENVPVGDLWHPRPFWKFVGATILSGIVIVVGLLLLIVPGIIFSLMFLFTSYIVIDRNLGPVKAMKESKRITKGHRGKLLGLLLAVAGLNILGIMVIVVGLLVSIPVTSLAMMHAYRTLTRMAPPAAA